MYYAITEYIRCYSSLSPHYSFSAVYYFQKQTNMLMNSLYQTYNKTANILEWFLFLTCKINRSSMHHI